MYIYARAAFIALIREVLYSYENCVTNWKFVATAINRLWGGVHADKSIENKLITRQI